MNIFQSDTISAFRDWQPNRGLRILIAFAVWEFAALITTLMWQVMPSPKTVFPWGTVILVKSMVWQIWGLIVPVILAVARRFSIVNATNKFRNFSILTIMSIVIIIVYGILYVAALEFYYIGAIKLRWTVNYGQTFLTFHILYFFLGIWLLFLLEHVFSYLKRIRELSIRALKAESETQKAKLESIRSRLNPHFLYNSLNAISGLVVSGKREEAADAIGRLGELLRGTLEHQGENFVKLEQELEIVGQYISVIKYRFGDKVRFVEKVDNNVSQLRVPSMILLPIIENAIKHGLGRYSEEVTIKLEAEINENCLSVSVTSCHTDKSAKDNGASGFGIGLSSIRERLSILYSENAEMQIIQENGAFKVVLSLPVEPPEFNNAEQD